MYDLEKVEEKKKDVEKKHVFWAQRPGLEANLLIATLYSYCDFSHRFFVPSIFKYTYLRPPAHRLAIVRGHVELCRRE